MTTLLGHEIYIRSGLGRMLRVTAIFTDAEQANEHMLEHAGQSVIAVIGPTSDPAFILLAEVADKGFALRRPAVDTTPK